MVRIHKSFITSKYLSLLCSGTVLMVLTAIMGVLDTLIAGIFLGEDAVAGICLVLPVYAMASFFAVCFSYGVPILYTKENGAFRKARADRYFGVGLTGISIVSLLMFALILLGGDAFLRSYQPAEPVYDCARAYLGWMKYAVLLLPLNELADGMLFADGDENVSLTANLTQGLLKVVLSVILCRSMGVKGLALASFISFAASILISCLHFFRPGNTLKPNLAFSLPMFGDVLKFGVVDGSTHLFISLFTTAINYFIVTRFGAKMLVLVSIITLLKEGQIVFEGIGEAITPLISTYLGEENEAGVRRIWNLARRTLRIESLVCTALLLVAAPLIVGLLGIQDGVVAGYAVWGLRVMSLTLIYTNRMYLDSSYFILVERISLGVLDSLRRDLVPALPLALLGGVIGGAYGMFIGLTLAPPLGYLIAVLYIKKRYGKENYPLFLADLGRMKRKRLYEVQVLPENIVGVRDAIGVALKDAGRDNRLVNRVMLTFEELFMLVYDCNPGKTVLAECTVEIGDAIRLTAKDDGRIMDLTDIDRDITSLRAYTLSNLLEAHTVQRVHALALSYNRNALEIR